MSQHIPQKPVNSPQAWLGKDMAESGAWIRHFSQDEIAELEAAATSVLQSGKPIFELHRDDFHLPLLKDVILQWLEELNQGRGFILLRGLPVEEWGFELSQCAYAGLGLHLGVLASQNSAGDILGHVRDTGADADDPLVRLYKTNRAQGFHVDGADIISLLCLRRARSGGESRIASSLSIFNNILQKRPDLTPLMFEPFHFDRQEELAAGEDPTFAIPLSYYDGDNLRMFYIGWYIRDAQRHAHVPRLTPEQLELLDLIDSTADELALDMNFQPGDIQLLKNSTILHGRSAFEDWPEPAMRRHLLRLWINPHNEFEDQGNIVKDNPTAPGAVSDADLLSQASPE
jgi:Taurine catabolism dioxygenase TauD, TfdA family